MQRQSLGSPSYKLQLNPSPAAASSSEKRSSAPPAIISDEIKDEKRPRSSARPNPSIHLIPVLTILCLLVLYLCSHVPSPQDLAGVGGRSVAAKAMISGAAEIGRYEMAARGLKEAEGWRRRRGGGNRKLVGALFA